MLLMYRVYLVTKITIVLKGQFIFSLRCRAVSFQCFNIEKFAHCRKTRDISYTVCIVRHRDGRAFLYTFAFPRAQVRQFFLRGPISCTTFFSRSSVLSRSCFAFLCSCVSECTCGRGVQLITRALYVYGRIRRVGSTRHRATHNPPSTRVRGVGV